MLDEAASGGGGNMRAPWSAAELAPEAADNRCTKVSFIAVTCMENAGLGNQPCIVCWCLDGQASLTP